MNKRLIIGIILLICIIFLLAFAFTSQKSQVQPPKKAVKIYPTFMPHNIPQTSLWLEQEQLKGEKKDTREIELVAYLNARENKLTSVQLELSYDPKVLQFVSIEPEDLLGGKHIFLKKVDAVKGRVSFGVENTPGKNQPPIQGADEIAKILFIKLTKAPQTQVTVLPESRVIAEDISESAVVDTRSLTVNLE